MDQIPQQHAVQQSPNQDQGYIPPNVIPMQSADAVQLGAGNRKKYIYIAVIIALLLLLIAGGTYFLLNRFNNQQGIASLVQPQETDSSIYKNQKFKFTIEYPKNFKSIETPDATKSNVVVAISSQRGTVLKPEDMIIAVAVAKSDFQHLDKSFGSYSWVKSIIEQVEGLPKDSVVDHDIGSLVSYGSVMVDGIKAVKYRVRPKREGPGIFPSINVALEKDNTTYLFSGQTGQRNLIFSASGSAVFDQMISTVTLD